MRYLRMLSNSVAAAVLATAYVLTLVLQLNPTLPLHPARLVPIATTVGLFYALHLTVIFYVVLVLWQLFARELFSPAWISVGVLTWLGAAAAVAGAALMWANLRTFELVLEPDTVRRLGTGRADARHVRGMLRVCRAAARASRAGAAAPLDGRVRGDRRPGRSSRRWRCAAAAPRRCSTRTARGVARRQRGRTAGAGHHSRGRRRIAGLHHQRHRRRAAAEFRPRPRCGRRHASGDPPPDIGGSRVGGGRDRKAAAEERRAVGGQLPLSTRGRPDSAAARLLLRPCAGPIRLPDRTAPHVRPRSERAPSGTSSAPRAFRWEWWAGR